MRSGTAINACVRNRDERTEAAQAGRGERGHAGRDRQIGDPLSSLFAGRAAVVDPSSCPSDSFEQDDADGTAQIAGLAPSFG